MILKVWAFNYRLTDGTTEEKGTVRIAAHSGEEAQLIFRKQISAGTLTLSEPVPVLNLYEPAK